MRVRCFGANICESDFFFDSADSTRHSFRLPTVPSCITEAGALKATLPRITGSWSSGWESDALTGDLESGKEAEGPCCWLLQTPADQQAGMETPRFPTAVSSLQTLASLGSRGNSDRGRSQVHIAVFTDVRTHCSGGSRDILIPVS